MSLAPLDVAFQLEYLRIIGERLAGNFQFSQSAVVIEVSAIKVFRARKVCFACIGTEAECRLDRCFGQRQTRGGMIVAEKVKLVMSVGELAIRLKKGRVAGDNLVEQISCL